MAQGKYSEAESLLLSALEKNSNDADSLSNMAIVAHHLGKTEVFLVLANPCLLSIERI